MLNLANLLKFEELTCLVYVPNIDGQVYWLNLF